MPKCFLFRLKSGVFRTNPEEISPNGSQPPSSREFFTWIHLCGLEQPREWNPIKNVRKTDDFLPFWKQIRQVFFSRAFQLKQTEKSIFFLMNTVVPVSLQMAVPITEWGHHPVQMGKGNPPYFWDLPEEHALPLQRAFQRCWRKHPGSRWQLKGASLLPSGLKAWYCPEYHDHKNKSPKRSPVGLRPKTKEFEVYRS